MAKTSLSLLKILSSATLFSFYYKIQGKVSLTLLLFPKTTIGAILECESLK